MLHSVMTDVALPSLCGSFQLVSQQASSELRSISARVHELPEYERPRLLAVVHDLEALQLRLRQLVDQLAPGGATNTNILETAIRDQIDLLRKVTALRERTGLHVHAMGGHPAAALQALQAALRALPPAGYQVVAAPAWPQASQPPRREAFPEADYDYLDAADGPRRHPSPVSQRVVQYEGPRRWAFLSPLRDTASVVLMLGAAFAGSCSFFDRSYRSGGSGETLAAFERLGREPETELGVAGQSDAIKKFQGRLESKPLVLSPAIENLTPTRGSSLIEQPGWEVPADRPIVPSGRGRPVAPILQRSIDIPSTAATGVQPTPAPLPPIAMDPALTPSSHRNSMAPSRTMARATTVALPTAIPAKPAIAKPASASADPDPAEPSGALFVPVLSTHKDIKAAREAFAELQKQHVAVLGAKQSEVQTSASEGGTWYRLVVTPASSKEMAIEVCNTLRVAGYGRCWVKPY
jgi:hypothetical protein